MLKLRVSQQEALTALARVPHDTFQRARPKHWLVDVDGFVDGRSVCWLYCWAKTGMGSRDAAKVAEHAFDKIFDIPFRVVAAKVPHEWARSAREASRSVDAELDAMLGSAP